jgi:predicted Fe-Mo cluster-binding NifX family protein
MSKSTKIAFVSDDAKHILGSFGSSKYFSVYTIENGEIVNSEVREVYKDILEQEVPSLVSKNNGMGIGQISLNVVDKSKEKHRKIASSVSDCEFVVARRMCANALDSVDQLKLKAIITKNKDFDQTVKEILEGSIKNYRDEIV